MKYLLIKRSQKIILISIFLILFTSIILITSCNSSKKTYQKEIKKRNNEFLTKLLFFHEVAYTLHGTKPITEVILDYRENKEKEPLLIHSQEKIDEKKEMHLQKIWSLIYQELPIFKDTIIEENYSFEETWDLWFSNLEKERIKRFIIISKKNQIFEEFENIYFINILETAKILYKHYDLFKKFYGMDFDPFAIVFEIENDDSVFWNRLFSKQLFPEKVCLWGLLFGYGIENAYPYTWLYHDFKNEKSMFSFVSLFKKAQQKNYQLPYIKKITPNSFHLPGFISFSDLDPNLKKYEKERKLIKKIYENTDLEENVLKILYD